MMLGVCAYLIWGFSALYWAQTAPVASADLVAHRALWSVPVVVICLAVAGRLGSALGLLRQGRVLVVFAGSALCSALNWMVFIWAVTHKQAMEASLGYFMLPLVNVIIGLMLFRESIDRAQALAITLAAGAIVLQVIHHGGLPVVALGLSLTFGLYGAIRKGSSVGSMEGLMLETLMMAPFALAWLWFHGGAGLGQHGLRVDLFILGGGLITAIPLMTYVAASRLLPLTALGLVFYIGPTAQLLVAVVVFGEDLEPVQFAAFALVWLGLLLITLDRLRRFSARRLSKRR